MTRVTGLGGAFFKARDPESLGAAAFLRGPHGRLQRLRGEADRQSMLRLLLSLIRPLPRARLAILHGRRPAW
jgi:hypothetical protein